MFIFQNNRGKKPTDLEIIKAEFMYKIHLRGGDETAALLEEIKNRFASIYRAISTIEDNVNEDDVLRYTVRIYFESLMESNTQDIMNKSLDKNDLSYL